MRVHLVRHGEVENPSNVRYGRLPSFRLSAVGRDEVLVTARALQIQPSKIMTSPLDRAVESAEIIREIVGGPEPIADERLTEASEWREGLPRRFGARPFFDRLRSEHPFPKTEKPWAIAERMSSAVLESVRLAASADDVLFVSHQTPIRLARLWFEKGPGSENTPWTVRLLPILYSRYKCSTASITTLVFEGARFARSEYRDSGMLLR